MGKDKGKVVLVAAPGRSGQGWLCYMLSYILNARFVEPYCLLRGVVDSAKPEIMAWTLGDLEGRPPTPYSLVVKTHDLPDPFFSLTDKVIVLARDPRDVAVSALDRYSARHKAGTDLTAADRAAAMIEVPNRLGLVDRLRNFVWSLPTVCYAVMAHRWKIFYERWGELPFICTVTYEEISTRPKETLAKVLRYLEVPVDDALLDDAIEKFSFQSLSGRKKGQEQRADTAFRKGVIGDHKSRFGPIDRFLIERLCGDVARRWGYLKEA